MKYLNVGETYNCRQIRSLRVSLPQEREGVSLSSAVVLNPGVNYTYRGGKFTET